MQDMPQNLSIIKVKQQVANRAIGGAGTAFIELAEQVQLLAPEQLKQSESDYFCNPARVIMDFYPRIGAFATDGKINILPDQKQQLSSTHLALLDVERLYFELLAFKQSKRWSNLVITPDVIARLLADSNWYSIKAPNEHMQFGNLQNLRLWHDMAISLLRKYCEMFYNFRRKQWEADKLEYRYITEDTSYLPGVREDTPNGSLIITLDPVRQDSLYQQLENIRQKIINGDIQNWQGQIADGLEFLHNERHFYQPLLTIVAKKVDYQVSPVPLNDGEARFVKDLQDSWEDELFLEDVEVYLLRNLVGQGAVGVFIDGGFEPDFILWVKQDNKQKIVFLDPKGLRHHVPTDQKIQFYRTIKKLERTMLQTSNGSEDIELHAFLLSKTKANVLESLWREHQGEKVTRELMESWNILFPHDDDKYIQKLVDRLI